ncbi:DUF4377 domain-containing protein [Alistipes megaguti]|uniref:DUF4377 domain-containing protein n=1 Tax=Alistipes megaguti TaxID=2364787 RepID=UPI002353E31E|nr:DUF4377 domain-containing protein [Alistipes megaguti]
MKKWLLLLMTPLVLGACDKDNTSRTEIWTIAPEKGVAGITMGFGYIPAYIVQKGANASWEIVPGPIEGFSFEEGWQTTLRVRIDRIANPPADGSSERYTMEEQLARTETTSPVDPLTFSPELEIRVASRRADAQIAAYWIQDLRYDTPQWQAFPSEIEGFDFKPGHEYRLRIQPVAVYDEAKSDWIDNDSWSVKYRLRELLSDEVKESEGLPE